MNIAVTRTELQPRALVGIVQFLHYRPLRCHAGDIVVLVIVAVQNKIQKNKLFCPSHSEQQRNNTSARVMSEYDEESDYEQLIHTALRHKRTQRDVHPRSSTAPRYVLRDIGAPVTAVHVSDSCGELFIGTQHGLVAQYSLQSYRRVSAAHLPQQRASVMALEEDTRAWLYRYVHAAVDSPGFFFVIFDNYFERRRENVVQ